MKLNLKFNQFYFLTFLLIINLFTIHAEEMKSKVNNCDVYPLHSSDRWNCLQVARSLSDSNCHVLERELKRDAPTIYQDFIKDESKDVSLHLVDKIDHVLTVNEILSCTYIPKIISSNFCLKIKSNLFLDPGKCFFDDEVKEEKIDFACLSQIYGFKGKCDDFRNYIVYKFNSPSQHFINNFKIEMERCENYKKILAGEGDCKELKNMDEYICHGLRQGIHEGVHPSVIKGFTDAISSEDLHEKGKMHLLSEISKNGFKADKEIIGTHLLGLCTNKEDVPNPYLPLITQLLANQAYQPIEEKAKIYFQEKRENPNVKKWFPLSDLVYFRASEEYPLLFNSFEKRKSDLDSSLSLKSNQYGTFKRCQFEEEKLEKIISTTLKYWGKHYEYLNENFEDTKEYSKIIDDSATVIKSMIEKTETQMSSYYKGDFLKRFILLCNGDNEISAMAILVNDSTEYFTEDTESSIYIDYLLSSPFHLATEGNPISLQKKGAGTQMIKEIIEYSRIKGMQGRIALSALESPKEFYKKFKFKAKPGTNYYYLSEEDSKLILPIEPIKYNLRKRKIDSLKE